MLSARGELRLHCDADCAASFASLPRLLDALEQRRRRRGRLAPGGRRAASGAASRCGAGSSGGASSALCRLTAARADARPLLRLQAVARPGGRGRLSPDAARGMDVRRRGARDGPRARIHARRGRRRVERPSRARASRWRACSCRWSATSCARAARSARPRPRAPWSTNLRADWRTSCTAVSTSSRTAIGGSARVAVDLGARSRAPAWAAVSAHPRRRLRHRPQPHGVRRLGPAAGVDLSPQAVSFCQRARAGRGAAGRHRAASVRGRPLRPVFATDVIEHLADDGPALSELRRVAAPGGRLMITVPAYNWLWSQHDASWHHFRRYTRPVLRERVRAHGWEPRDGNLLLLLLLPPVALVRTLQRLRSDGNGYGRRTSTSPRRADRFLDSPVRGEAELIKRGVSLSRGRVPRDGMHGRADGRARLLSVVVPVHDEEEVLPELHERLAAALAELPGRLRGGLRGRRLDGRLGGADRGLGPAPRTTSSLVSALAQLRHGGRDVRGPRPRHAASTSC